MRTLIYTKLLMMIVSRILFLLMAVLVISCSGEYYSEADYYKVPKIDVHAHQHGDNPALIQQAIDDNFRLLLVSVDAPHYVSAEEQKQTSFSMQKQFPKSVGYLTTFSMKDFGTENRTNNVLSQLTQDISDGALGIKIWKNVGMVEKDSAGRFIMIDDPRFDTIARLLIAADKTLLGHLGEPRNCWLPLDQMTVNSDREYFKNHPEYHMFLHPEYPSYEDQINARDRFVAKHPELRFVGAHLGSLEWNVDSLAARLDKFPNMAVDLAERICHLQYQSLMDKERVRNFIIKYQDRIIYGSDLSIAKNADTGKVKNHAHELWLREWKYLTTGDTMTVPQVNGSFTGLKLPKEIVDKIYYKNAAHWFKWQE